MSNGTNIPQNQEELSQYEEGWAKVMVDMWHEQLAKVHAIDTGNLYGSITGNVQQGENAAIVHQFSLYGIYVENGTGFGYRKGNGGDLPFLDKTYREEHGLDKPRKRGPAWGGGYTSGNTRERRWWFTMKYYYSIYRLNDVLAESYGERGRQMVFRTLDAIFREKQQTNYFKEKRNDNQ